MDRPLLKDSNCVVDTLRYNHTQYSCILLNPSRNSYLFEGFINYDIINFQVKEKINFLKEIGFQFEKKCEIKCTSESWSIKYDDNIDNPILKILIDEQNLKYIEINKTIKKNEKMIEMINSIPIKYNPLSFRQSDDSIRNEIYKILEENVYKKKIYFIGGEMIFYKVLLNPSEYIMYTDFLSIYEDSIQNGNLNTFLIDYDKDTLLKKESDYILIANTSKSGLGENLAKSILSIELDQIVIISCNKKSFQRDFIILEQKYSINKVYELKTNYIVYIYFLYKKI